MIRNYKNELIVEWGKSMYGGWYATIDREDGTHDGYRERTLKELSAKVGLSVSSLRGNVTRRDY